MARPRFCAHWILAARTRSAKARPIIFQHSPPAPQCAQLTPAVAELKRTCRVIGEAAIQGHELPRKVRQGGGTINPLNCLVVTLLLIRGSQVRTLVRPPRSLRKLRPSRPHAERPLLRPFLASPWLGIFGLCVETSSLGGRTVIHNPRRSQFSLPNSSLERDFCCRRRAR